MAESKSRTAATKTAAASGASKTTGSAQAPASGAKSAAVKAPMLGKQSKADLPAALFSEPFH
jgi:hypothetical protein